MSYCPKGAGGAECFLIPKFGGFARDDSAFSYIPGLAELRLLRSCDAKSRRGCSIDQAQRAAFCRRGWELSEHSFVTGQHLLLNAAASAGDSERLREGLRVNVPSSSKERIRVSGKFFRAGQEKWYARGLC